MEFASTNTPFACNVLHYRIGSITGVAPGSDAFLSAVGAAAEAKFAPTWKAAASEEVDFTAVTVTSVFPLPRSRGFKHVNSAPISGLELSQALPLQDSVTILKRTNVGMRWGLGRLFFVGIAEGDQQDGIITNGLATDIGAFATKMEELLTVAGTGWSIQLNPCIVRGPEDNPVSITNITSCQLSNQIIKSLKRRRPGKGI